jgi:hypothetical protein
MGGHARLADGARDIATLVAPVIGAVAELARKALFHRPLDGHEFTDKV